MLDDPQRDECPGARRLVAYRLGDDPPYLALLRRRASAVTRVSRFGRELLSVAEISARRSTAAQRAAEFPRRWRAARPIVLPGIANAWLAREDVAIRELSKVFRALRKPGSLARFLRAHLDAQRLEVTTARDDPERDLEKLFVDDGGAGQRLWVKSATLTSPTTNASGRIRFSFGAEGDDDASADEAAHARVARLARRCTPLAERAARSRPLAAILQPLVGAPVLLTQHILYWNAPQGGALLHHDAFDEPARTRQRGVCYVQLSGSTIWLALSTADLAKHVRAFLEDLARGEAPWALEDHFGGWPSFTGVLRNARDADWLARELTSPGCGAFATLVNYSPEFLGLLIDAGHAWRLAAGDAILLPNHGYRRTALHAVWCAGRTPGLALSMAIRRAAPA